MDLRTLYKTNTRGKSQVWKIQVVNNKIISEHGQLDGELQITEKIIKKGKNIGRSNETTPEEQAFKEAESMYKLKIKNGYGEKILKKGEELFRVMLAQDVTKQKKDIWVQDYFTQPKLDGIRCWIEEKDEIIMRSRNQTLFCGLDHIRKKCIQLFKKLPKGTKLDGELFTTKITFQEITSLVNKKKIDDSFLKKQKVIEFHMYDIFVPSQPELSFKEREKIFKKACGKSIVICVNSKKVSNEEDGRLVMNKYIEEGYEGIILRDPEAPYQVGKRSKSLLKWKDFVDEEFVIVDAIQGTGRDKGAVIWICKTKDGQTFNVRPKGTMGERKELYKDREKFIGEKLTVIFQNYTDEGLPRFPVGKCFRNYE